MIQQRRVDGRVCQIALTQIVPGEVLAPNGTVAQLAIHDLPDQFGGGIDLCLVIDLRVVQMCAFQVSLMQISAEQLAVFQIGRDELRGV